ncbi:RNA repair transcriptional activator RtcR [Variovorax sp. J22G21]|uniref:RNA repair transcriptional activator RtcR n=1 Tax=Variovorax fucosicus TaxID=3053517 RepID=UPI002578AFA4|nr:MULTISPECIES: RNA repair transcriptional activator RtcR [unclassified Variovorax]MDM0042646.1 RNA repair transcriptional activator RtcR [Variovorax sp. J22R193]MDM0061251.1 RNA repair transcriptional activator RtcR [Variovorax sp. J22G21]
MKPTVVIGFLGTQLDSGRGAGRWAKWRPTVSLVQHEDQVVSRLELIHTRNHLALAEVVRADIASVSPETVVNLVELSIADPWDFGEVYARLYDWARAYPFDTEREQYWTHITTGTHVAQICMFLLAESRFIPGVLAQTAPPKRQRPGEAGSVALIDLDLSRYDVIARRFEAEQRDAVSFLKSGIATRNARFNTLIDEIERVAVRSRAPILLVGPTGAGKSFLARRMFELKKARHQVTTGAFVEVNCATLRGDGAASTLFGHKKGAFTGAAAERAGLLRSAHEGVLFLDEIGELGLDEQAMLLKAIEEKRFFPMGADREVTSDFQLIAGSNRDLRHEVAAGRFREDLFARINLWTYDLPGLAQRPEDIDPNLDHLLTLYASENNRVVRFNAEARVRYLHFAQSADALWSGNFRDLSASVTRLATLADGGRITVELAEAEIARLRWLWKRTAPQPGGSDDVDLSALLGPERAAALDLFDRLQLEAVVRVCRQSRTLSDAGRRLFHASRTQRSVLNDADRLRKYLGKHGLQWTQLAGVPA